MPSYRSDTALTRCPMFASSRDAGRQGLCTQCDAQDALFRSPALAASPPAPQSPLESSPLALSAAGETTPQPKQKKPNRCAQCEKKVGLLGFDCKCNSTFCSAHRYPYSHNCPVDTHAAAKDNLRRLNPAVQVEKMDTL